MGWQDSLGEAKLRGRAGPAEHDGSSMPCLAGSYQSSRPRMAVLDGSNRTQLARCNGKGRARPAELHGSSRARRPERTGRDRTKLQDLCEQQGLAGRMLYQAGIGRTCWE